MINVAVIGATGRMGKLIINNIINSNDLKLSGAIEIPSCPFIGHDAGILTGNHEYGATITSDINNVIPTSDVFIDFSTGPVVENAEKVLQKDKCAIIGTTGLSNQQKEKLNEIVENNNGKVVFAPNMSIGVNLLFHITKLVSEILNDDYDVEIVEMHHNQKKDAPSGTAQRLAEIIADARNLNLETDAKYGRCGITGPREKSELGIHVLRGGDVVGDHTVIYSTEGERVELTHKASSKETFVKGAITAARFIVKASPGIYDMQDVLNIKSSKC
jgi:4-hydroxy-tetrahydrodipicolinate reductase